MWFEKAGTFHRGLPKGSCGLPQENHGESKNSWAWLPTENVNKIIIIYIKQRQRTSHATSNKKANSVNDVEKRWRNQTPLQPPSRDPIWKPNRRSASKWQISPDPKRINKDRTCNTLGLGSLRQTELQHLVLWGLNAHSYSIIQRCTGLANLPLSQSSGTLCKSLPTPVAELKCHHVPALYGQSFPTGEVKRQSHCHRPKLWRRFCCSVCPL